MRSFASVAAAACSTFLLTACGAATPPAAPATQVERARVTMGSELRLTAWTTDEPAALAAFDDIFADFDRLEGLLSIWRDGSDVQRLNAAAGLHPVTVSA